MGLDSMTTLAEVPSVAELIPATTDALKALGGSASNEEIHDKIVEMLSLPDSIVELPHEEGSSRTRLDYRLRWARTYLKKVNAAENTERGVWTLTPLGRAMSSEDLADVRRRVAAIGRAQKAKDEETSETEDATEEPSWAEKLLSVLQAIQPDTFERLIQLVLRESGFTKVEVTGRSGDGGIDGHGVLRVKLVSFQVLFQCKRWRGSVGPSVVRDFRGAMVGRADKGLIVTTSRFTAEARREAIRDGAPAIDLVDGEDLCHLLKELGIGVRVRKVEEVDIDEGFFADF